MRYNSPAKIPLFPNYFWILLDSLAGKTAQTWINQLASRQLQSCGSNLCIAIIALLTPLSLIELRKKNDSAMFNKYMYLMASQSCRPNTADIRTFKARLRPWDSENPAEIYPKRWTLKMRLWFGKKTFPSTMIYIYILIYNFYVIVLVRLFCCNRLIDGLPFGDQSTLVCMFRNFKKTRSSERSKYNISILT